MLAERPNDNEVAGGLGPWEPRWGKYFLVGWIFVAVVVAVVRNVAPDLISERTAIRFIGLWLFAFFVVGGTVAGIAASRRKRFGAIAATPRCACCGYDLRASRESLRCPECGEPQRCTRCGYDLRGSGQALRCPECGEPFEV